MSNPHESSSLLEDALPVFDVAVSESVVVHAAPVATLDAARNLDFLRVRTPLLVAAMWIRGLPQRFSRRAPSHPPERLVLGQGDPLPGWLVFGESDTELAFGAVGKFWQGTIEWRDVERDEFAEFQEPGFGKIACAFRVAACGPNRTLLTYECRTGTTSEDARVKFARYWWLIRPFVAHIMRATVAAIGRDTERESLNVP